MQEPWMPDLTDLWTHRKTDTLYVWISKGIRPRSYKLNGSRRYDPRDVQEFIRQRSAATMQGTRGHAAL